MFYFLIETLMQCTRKYMFLMSCWWKLSNSEKEPWKNAHFWKNYIQIVNFQSNCFIYFTFYLEENTEQAHLHTIEFHSKKHIYFDMKPWEFVPHFDFDTYRRELLFWKHDVVSLGLQCEDEELKWNLNSNRKCNTTY